MSGRQCWPERIVGTTAMAAVLILLSACDGSQTTPEETPTSSPDSPITFTIDLPEGWNDLIDEYRSEVPNTVLSAFWSKGSDLDSGEPFATVSVGMYGPDSVPSHEVREDLDSWERRLDDAVWGENGGVETSAGGAGRWGSITGMRDGRETTIHSVHLYHGPYKLMVLIETYDGDVDSAYEILDALETVEFSGPIGITGRAGSPSDEDGRWYSYCRTVSIPVQESWTYDFDSSYDRTPWDCPKEVDILGAWDMEIKGVEHEIAIYRFLAETFAEVRDSFSVPDIVGESQVSPSGFTHTLVFEGEFGLSDGTMVTWSQDQLESPEGFVTYGHLLGFDTSAGGSVVVMLFNAGYGFVDDVGVVVEVLDTLTMAD